MANAFAPATPIGYVIGLVNAIQNVANMPVPNMIPPITFDPEGIGAGDDGTGGIGGPGGIGSVSAGPATAADAATGEAVGVTGDAGIGTGGPSADGVGGVGDGTGSAGDGPGSGDGASGGGWAEGGTVPKQADDPKGIKDTVKIPVSGGEYVFPADVVAAIGVPALDMLKNMFHTPAKEQGTRKPDPMYYSPSGGVTTDQSKTPEGRMAGQNQVRPQLLPILLNNGLDFENAGKTVKAIKTLRENNNHELANAMENMFNTINQGRSMPLSAFHLPNYLNSPGYR
jgi:hypothetical protein